MGSKKKQPTIINVSEASMDAIQSRVNSSALLEEDKKIILSIMSVYTWLVCQLQTTKLTIHRLKSLFGFSTEKRPLKKKKEDDTGQDSSLTATEEPPTKK